MLSILIPIYNQPVLHLVRELSGQASYLDCSWEIICVDDASRPKNKKSNEELKTTPNVLYEELSENIGRARIRNLLASKARYPILLFLDGDTEILDQSFLQRYIQQISPKSVLVGGRVYPETCPSAAKKLHWRTGSHREQNESSAFQSNNFLISAEIFDCIRFDENLSGYGHEDTLFGFKLNQRGFLIKYINNPTKHDGLENAETFLHNQSEAIVNLAKISAQYPMLKTPLIRTSDRLKLMRIDGLVRRTISTLNPMLYRSLLGKWPTLFVLDLYKLGAFLRATKQNKEEATSLT